jgi:transposase
LPPAYQAAFAAQQAARARLEGEVKALTERNQRLEHLVREFRQALYVKRSEKLDADARQLAFEDLEAALAEVEEAKARSTGMAPPPFASSGPAARPAAKRNLGRLPTELPRLEQLIEPASFTCPCGCGAMVRIGEDVTERLDIVPAQFRVIVAIRPKYACPTCQEGVHWAPTPAHLIEGGLPTEATLAHVLVGKFADHLPLYRQAPIYRRQGIDLDRSTLAGWVGKMAFHVEPVVDRLAVHRKSSSKLFPPGPAAPVPFRGRMKGLLAFHGRDARAGARSGTRPDQDRLSAPMSPDIGPFRVGSRGLLAQGCWPATIAAGAATIRPASSITIRRVAAASMPSISPKASTASSRSPPASADAGCFADGLALPPGRQGLWRL